MKIRLDQLLVARGPAPSRAQALALVQTGRVRLDASLKEIPGHISGKVTMVKPTASDRFEAASSFTSVSPEIYQILRLAAETA
ncbi:MAG TPA: S4 domain-containing protein [Desulfobaccales bacterium]